MRNVLIIIAVFSLSFFLACSPKQQSAVEYMNELSSQLISCTTEAEYDKVYEEIVALKDDARFSENDDLSENEKLEIVKGMTALVYKALVIKAILNVIPASVIPTSQDMNSLADECINNNANVYSPPYSDVKAIVYKYYKISE